MLGICNGEIEMDSGLRLIVFYKMVKAISAWCACGVLLVLLGTGKMHQMHEAAMVLRDQMTNGISLGLTKLLVAALTVPRFHLAILALSIDGTFSFVEAWSLRRRFWWAPWLVLIGTATLLPFEITLLARGIRIGRVIVFAINATIFVYLAQRTWREHRAAVNSTPWNQTKG
jgi:uncharacterized membrane protein (DUF2068 family)